MEIRNLVPLLTIILNYSLFY